MIYNCFKDTIIKGKKGLFMASSYKFVLFNEGGFFYKYRLVANNGQKMFISEPYKNEKACKTGIETLKKNIETLKIDIEKDKKGQYCFRAITAQGRPLGQSANYATKKQAEQAAASLKKYASTDVIEQNDDDYESIFEVDLLKEKVEQSDKGKYEIVYDKADDDYYYVLKANNGQVLCSSQAYQNKESCEGAIEMFRKQVYEGDFYIFVDKKGNAFFKLYSSQLRLVMTGETYSTKKLAMSAATSVLKFAAKAKYNK